MPRVTCSSSMSWPGAEAVRVTTPGTYLHVEAVAVGLEQPGSPSLQAHDVCPGGGGKNSHSQSCWKCARCRRNSES